MLEIDYCVNNLFISSASTTSENKNVANPDECIICRDKQTSRTGSGYEKLDRCSTFDSATTLINYVNERNDTYGKIQLGNLEPSVVVSKEFMFHRSCFKNISRPEKEVSKEKGQRDKCFSELEDFVREEVIRRGRIIRMATITEQYRKIQEENGLKAMGCITANLKSRLSRSFGDDLTFFKKTQTSAEIVYGENINVMTEEEKVKDIANLIRNELMALKEQSVWPPNPDKIRNENVIIPNLLNTFLTSLLTKHGKPSDRVKRLIKSLGQDIMYNVTRGNIKTVKHTQLGIFIKRVTGSRLVIDCLNRFGHTISYHEINSLETAFAEVQMQHQLVPSYVPPRVLPSKFVTFVYDNCDHNPESLSGTSMHVTNGIMIQLSDLSNQLRNSDQELNVRKRKSFTAMNIDIAHYKKSERVRPPSLGNINKAKNLDQYLYMKTDLVWLLLRRQSQIMDLNQNIPAWTGFNYEV